MVFEPIFTTRAPTFYVRTRAIFYPRLFISRCPCILTTYSNAGMDLIGGKFEFTTLGCIVPRL